MDRFKGLSIMLGHSVNSSEMIQYKKMTCHFQNTDNKLNISDGIEFVYFIFSNYFWSKLDVKLNKSMVIFQGQSSNKTKPDFHI